MSFWSDPIGNIENAVSNPVQAIKNLAPTIGQIGAIGSAVMQGGTNPMADLAAFNATAGLLGGSSSSPSATIPTANTTGGTASPKWFIYTKPDRRVKTDARPYKSKSNIY